MKSFALAIIISTMGGVMAERLLACGHHLVNSQNHPWTQSEIARAACGRSDTCNGEEWNTLFEVLPMSSGPSSWVEIKSTGVYCHKGCWGDIDKYNGQCH
ncbi:hypothetical protein C8A00DRAFT_34540 [Chaetomidium leptoderma]|uniref:Uncharacterized protein n=1 Tax=Chaetomidium leptoderma TaxID=669021 RepID=A0AAN6VK63_9PEZI|nr:hypothetical protein C8A00DRAFT_34540 [Chaetomidium leptoderma]